MLNRFGHVELMAFLADATDGINQVSIATNLSETAKQTITWDSAVSVAGGTGDQDDTAYVSMSATVLGFTIPAGETVLSVRLYHDLVEWGYISFASSYYFPAEGTFSLTDITITIGNV